jgi:hypothetical protein
VRIANRLLAFVVAAALIAAAVIVIVEVIAYKSNADPLLVHWRAIRDWGRDNTWAANSVKVAALITLVAGLVVLLPQLLRQTTRRLAIETDGPVEATLTRKSVGLAVRTAVTDVDTVTGARVKVKRRAVNVAAECSSLDPEIARNLIGDVEDAANEQLAALRLTTPLRVRASVGYRRNGRV